MSAPSTRGQRGGSSTRGGRATPFTPGRGRGSGRGSSRAASAGRGRGRGGSSTSATSPGSNNEGLLQRLRTGTVKRAPDNAASSSGRGRGAAATSAFSPSARGRGRGLANLSQTFATPKSQPSTPGSRSSSPLPSNHRDFMNNAFAKFQVLKQTREEERAKAIRDGFLADPEKKTSLDKAITPVGTCTDMCPEFERVERIVQNMVDKAEKVHNEDTGKDMPAEERMVKRFRRSAAGYDEQLPSDIRTPATLKLTLDYLLDKVVGGGERLATIHKFVWDRTRGIRNDFSIQQVTNVQDVKIAVECYERIARFHILSLHQLSNPDNLWEGENFDAHQEREQLNNTLLSLLYYYDDNRQRMEFPNEGEFRAYCIIFEFQSQHPDMEDRMQAWPRSLLKDRRVQTALKLYRAAGNSLFEQGPLRPTEPFPIAQSNTGGFWNVLSSEAVSYVTACVAEIYFGHVRFAALDALWRSCKSAPAAQQAKSRDWSLGEVTSFLGFDDEEETRAFCAAFALDFATDEHGDEYLDATANSAYSLDQSSIPSQQSFSHSFVEKKRLRRTLTAVINGVTVAEAIRQGWVVPTNDEEERAEDDAGGDDQSMFFPEARSNLSSASSSTFGSSSLNPQASTFAPKFGDATASPKPVEQSTFGQPSSTSFGQSSSFGKFGSSGVLDSSTASSTPTFGQSKVPSTSTFGQSTTPSGSTFGQSTTPSASTFGQSAAPSTSTFGQSTAPSGSTFGQSTAPSTSTFGQSAAPSSSFGGFSAQVTSSPSIFGNVAPVQPPSEPFAFGGFVSHPKELSLKPQTNDPEHPAIANTGTFGGFKFGKPPSATPAPDTVPPIFGPRPTAPAPSEGAKTATTSSPSATAPFQFSSLTPSSPQTLQPPGSVDLSKETQPKQVFPPKTIASAPPEQPFSFQPLATQAQVTPTIAKSPIAPAFPATDNTTQRPSFSFPSAATSDSPKPSSNQDGKPKFPDAFKFTTHTPPTASSSDNIDVPPKQFQLQPTVDTAPPAAKQPFLRSTTPPYSPRQPPSKPVFTKADRERLAETVSKVALVQPKGLLYSYVEFIIQDLVTTALNQHALEVRDAAIASVRERILARKFGYLWRSRAWTSSLNRRAKNRRHLFAETMRAEQERKKRSEEELDEILRATRETKRLQREVKQATQTQDARTVTQKPAPDVGRIAGQKRKEVEGSTPKSSAMPANGTPLASGHKRSKTMAAFAKSSQMVQYQGSSSSDFRASTSRSPHVSIFSRSSVLGRSTSNSDLRRSSDVQRVDTTRTDYFKLKALGVDPETPIVPDTKETFASRRLREADERRAIIDRAKRHIKSSAVPGPSNTGETAPSVTERTQTHATNSLPIEDGFLKQIREAREAMAEQTEWFKSQSATLGEEIKLEEQSRQSQSTPDVDHTVSTNGLARINGYEYLPGQLKSGLNLSRTEQRIRATGAHGLATKPVRSTSEYVPVAMSKRSARNYAAGSNWSSPARKRSHDDMESETNTPESTGNIRNLHASKRSRAIPNTHEKPKPASHRQGTNPYQMLQYEEEELEAGSGEEDDAVTDEFDEEEIAERYQRPYDAQTQNGASAEEDGEEELEEEDDEEDLEEEEEYEEYEDEEEELDEEGRRYEYPAYIQQHSYGDDDEDDEDDEDEDDEEGPSPQTNPQLSRAASSAPGASMDDALVLSDSD